MTLAAAAGLVAGGAFTSYTTVYADDYNVRVLLVYSRASPCMCVFTSCVNVSNEVSNDICSPPNSVMTSVTSVDTADPRSTTTLTKTLRTTIVEVVIAATPSMSTTRIH